MHTVKQELSSFTYDYVDNNNNNDNKNDDNNTNNNNNDNNTLIIITPPPLLTCRSQGREEQRCHTAVGTGFIVV